MHIEHAIGGTFKPAIASIAEAFVVIVLSNGCFWLTKWLLIVLVDYNIHTLTYKMQPVEVMAAFLFFAVCRRVYIRLPFLHCVVHKGIKLEQLKIAWSCKAFESQ